MYNKLHIYFVGIGGIGMSGIAEVLLNLGYPVSGSDIKRTPITDRLRRLGAKIHIGHKESNVKDIDVMVVSSAVKSTNPEVVIATKRKIRIIQRAEMLAEIMRLAKYGVAIAGTHGKTTTTSLLATVLHTAGLDPTAVIGGKVRSLRSNAKLGRGEFMVTEADESDGSFLKLYPSICVVTNMDPEHMDHYGTFDNYRDAFFRFCSHVPFYGLAILCGEHPETCAIHTKLEKRSILYGFSKKHKWNAQNIEFIGPVCHYDLYAEDKFITKIELNTPGKHNVLNSLAVIAVCREIGVDFKLIKKGMKSFKGVGRRMEVLFKSADQMVIDDYGHHPAEVKATLHAIRRAFAGRLVVLFQPHRYTRTRDLFEDFLTSFDLADHLFVMGVYPAGETPIRGVTGKKLAEKMAKVTNQKVEYLPHSETMVQKIVNELRPGDVFLSLGAGDVTKIGHEVAKELKKKLK